MSITAIFTYYEAADFIRKTYNLQCQAYGYLCFGLDLCVLHIITMTFLFGELPGIAKGIRDSSNVCSVYPING